LEGLFSTFFAHSANFNEVKVSSACFIEGPMQTIIEVREFPPRESYKSLVSFESLNGICLSSFYSVKAFIQFPRQEREKLIFLASSSHSSLAPVFLTLSLPARSTKKRVL